MEVLRVGGLVSDEMNQLINDNDILFPTTVSYSDHLCWITHLLD